MVNAATGMKSSKSSLLLASVNSKSSCPGCRHQVMSCLLLGVQAFMTEPEQCLEQHSPLRPAPCDTKFTGSGSATAMLKVAMTGMKKSFEKVSRRKAKWLLERVW